MKQHWNVILFVVLSMATIVGWQTFLLPKLVPQKPAAKADQAKAPKGEHDKSGSPDKKTAETKAAIKTDHGQQASVQPQKKAEAGKESPPAAAAAAGEKKAAEKKVA